MTYYGPKEMAASFRTVRGNTIKIADEIPEKSYSFRATPDSRSVAETLVHIASSTRLPLQVHITEKRETLEGFDFLSFLEKQRAEEKAPRTKADILKMLKEEGDRYARALEGLSEAVLSARVQFPKGMEPPSKTRFELLLGPKEHEMHHRGQLMVVQRMLGMVPPLTRQMDERIAAMKTATAGAGAAKG